MEQTKKRKPRVELVLDNNQEENKKLVNLDGPIDAGSFNLAELSKNKKDKNNDSLEKLNTEIHDDFNNLQRRNNFQGFSEFSSTIHFTALNSKDLINSKFNKYQPLANQGYSIKSASMVNVLEELNNHNFPKYISQNNHIKFFGAHFNYNNHNIYNNSPSNYNIIKHCYRQSKGDKLIYN